MNGIRLCNETPSVIKAKPALAGSGWIDAANAGDLQLTATQAALADGLRLRWFLPWDAASNYLPIPKSIRVLRGSAVEVREFTETDCGIVPTLNAPPNMWHVLVGAATGNSDVTFQAQHGETLEAVYFANSSPNDLSVSLILENGRVLACGLVKAGQKFYFEGSNISKLVLSGYPGTNPEGLIVDPNQVREMTHDLVYHIKDARAFLNSDLEEVAKRLGFTSTDLIDFDGFDWNEFKDTCGRALQCEVDSWTKMQLVLAEIWEVAVLAGFGIIDGDLNETPLSDELGSQLTKPADNGTFFYTAEIEVEKLDGSTSWEYCCAIVRPLALSLNSPSYRSENGISVRSRLLQQGEVTKNSSGSDEIKTIGEATVYACEGVIEAEFSYGYHQTLDVLPVPSKSILAKRDAEPQPKHSNRLFDSRDGSPLVRWDGLTISKALYTDFEAPFVDANVKFEISTRDQWGRAIETPGFGPLDLDLIYDSLAPTVKQGMCDAGRATVALIILESSNDWKPLEIDVILDSEVVVFARRESDIERSYKVTLGLPAPDANECFSATISFIEPEPDVAAKSALLNGRLVVGNFQAQIKGFGKDAANQTLIVFEVPGSCGAFSFFANGSAGIIVEPGSSERLWTEVGTLSAVNLEQELAKLQNIRLLLDDPYKSQLFYFTTALRTKLDKEYRGPINLPGAPTQYYAPKPPAPVVQAFVKRLGTDFYGRHCVKFQGMESDLLDERFQYSASLSTVSADEVFDKEESKLEAVKKSKLAGDFGFQSPFERATLFENYVADLPEEAVLVGFSAKNIDDRESEMTVQRIRRII
ncbi:MAG: hypothetical protein IPL32_17195 [Chloracidobacterium sp.]|nr:hypothetical protein [Chloracidobacterium sp.]